MSIKDMFTIARAYGDPVTNGLNQFKDYLSVENGINKNWQDALTFDQNIAAINAHNAQKAYEDQQRLLKQKGEFAALQQQAAHLYDPNTGQYRPEYQANQLAAREVYETGNPYARQANYADHRAAALKAADAIGAIDPAQATNLRNSAWGDFGIRAQQAPDGTLTVRNSQGYTQTTANPHLAALYGISPDKTAQMQTGWQRDDQVSERNFAHQIGAQNNQAALQQALIAQKATNQPQTNSIDHKTLDESTRYYYKLLMETGEYAPDVAFNRAQQMALSSNGLPTNATTTGSPDVGSVLTAHVKPKDAPAATTNKQQPAAAAPLGSSFLAGNRIGFYLPPHPAETREAEIKQLNDYIAQMQAKWQQNTQTNANPYLIQQQADALRAAQNQLNRINKETDAQYFQRMNPLESAWNKIWYGDYQPKQGIK